MLSISKLISRVSHTLSFAPGLLGCSALIITLHGCSSTPPAIVTTTPALPAPPTVTIDSTIMGLKEPQTAPTSPTSSPPTPLPPAIPAPGTTPYEQRPDVQAWAQAVASRTGLPLNWLQAAFAEARYQPYIAKLILPAPTGKPKNWLAYRDRFIEPKRIKAGLTFWKENEAWLKQAEKEYGIAPEIIVGIIGVETFYGRDMGRFRILDALVTLAFDFPANAPRDRSEYFRNELEQYYLLCRNIRANPLEMSSSYAGAIGIPQFMPSSWRKYAVDYDEDGRIDLIHNPADAIGSVARYLAEFGWVKNMPAYYPIEALPEDSEQLSKVLLPDITPSFTQAELKQLGVKLPMSIQHSGLLAIVKLENGNNPPSYVAGTDNFFAITRYNQSSPYAMAVIELGQAIKQARQMLPRNRE